MKIPMQIHSLPLALIILPLEGGGDPVCRLGGWDLLLKKEGRAEKEPSVGTDVPPAPPGFSQHLTVKSAFLTRRGRI